MPITLRKNREAVRVFLLDLGLDAYLSIRTLKMELWEKCKVLEKCKGLKTKEVHRINNLDQKLFLQNAVWLICVV